MTLKVKDVIRDFPATINYNKTVLDALMKMTISKFGAITVVDDNNNIHRIFTDGDFRRLVETGGESVLPTKFTEIKKNIPLSVDSEAYLIEASKIFKTQKVDNLIVIKNNKPVGMLDIHDLL